jgi:hypothetical protein
MDFILMLIIKVGFLFLFLFNNAVYYTHISIEWCVNRVILYIPVCVHQKIGWFLKLLFDQNHHLINHMPNDNFKSHIIFW